MATYIIKSKETAWNTGHKTSLVIPNYIPTIAQIVVILKIRSGTLTGKK